MIEQSLLEWVRDAFNLFLGRLDELIKAIERIADVAEREEKKQ